MAYQAEGEKYLFFDQIWIPNIIQFSEITEYQISNNILYWENPNTKFYSVSRKSEYQIQIVLFGLKIQILVSSSIIFFRKNKIK